MSDFNYEKIRPFKWFVLENFPFIEADFDAITNYQLYSKVVEYLNKVITDMNSVGEQTETLTNSFNQLQNYVNNYFDNLDVQDEIDNKLDEMVEDGTFDQYFEWLFERQYLIVFGDSYTAGTNNDLEKCWADILADMLSYKLEKHAFAGIGFTTGIQAAGGTISNVINNQTLPSDGIVKKVIIYAGINDSNVEYDTEYTNVVNALNLAKTKYEDASIILVGPQTTNNGNIKSTNKLITCFMRACAETGCGFVNANDWLYKNAVSPSVTYKADNVHPSDIIGQNIIACNMLSAINSSSNNIIAPNFSFINDFEGTMSINTTENKIEIYINTFFESWTQNSNVFVAESDNDFYNRYSTQLIQCPVYEYDNTYGFAKRIVGFASYLNTGGNARKIKFVNTSGANISDMYVQTKIEIPLYSVTQ